MDKFALSFKLKFISCWSFLPLNSILSLQQKKQKIVIMCSLNLHCLNSEQCSSGLRPIGLTLPMELYWVNTMYYYEIRVPDEKLLWFKPITEPRTWQQQAASSHSNKQGVKSKYITEPGIWQHQAASNSSPWWNLNNSFIFW